MTPPKNDNDNEKQKLTNKNTTTKLIAAGILIGTIITLVILKLLPVQYLSNAGSVDNSTDIDENKPLYWVAPMDANYKRDQPGQSPMGMDLIPYYGSQNNTMDEGEGTIKISPSVVNNLGVRTTKASYGALNTTIETVGYVTYDEDKLVHIHPRISGWVEKLHINAIGDPVTKGQPLYDIYSPELVNAQEELLLALDRKNQRLISAAENRLIALQIPRYAINALKKDKKVQLNVTFYAPQNGVVESLFVRQGFYVKPETMMLSIVDLTQVWVKAEFFERDVFKVAIGDSASMRLDYLPSKQWQGNVEHVHPMLDPKTRTGVVRLQFDNQNGDLKPNMFAQISIAISNNEPALQVPREAVIRTGNQDRVVLALGDGYFKSVAVKIGRFDRHNIEILSGLSAGEKVVRSAQFLLDSESSKSSDFKRMNADKKSNSDSDEEIDMQNQSDIASATVHGTVTSVMTDHRMVTIDREAIVKWDREAATIDFIVADSVDMTLFTLDAYLMFTFEIQAGEFIIVSAMTMTPNINHGMSHGMPQGLILTGDVQ
ncbi:MAG TPA: efflux RND transporter periplasmic adaptor subunit [Colwellia sp.]|nr:efflux RND transporter periplasmic adaptor subunit [Colwellia sp.]